MKAALLVVLIAVAFGAGLGMGTMLMLRAGVMQKPDRIVVTRWIFPPIVPTTMVPNTPLTPEEQRHLEDVIHPPTTVRVTTRPPPSTSTLSSVASTSSTTILSESVTTAP